MLPANCWILDSSVISYEQSMGFMDTDKHQSLLPVDRIIFGGHGQIVNQIAELLEGQYFSKSISYIALNFHMYKDLS